MSDWGDEKTMQDHSTTSGPGEVHHTRTPHIHPELRFFGRFVLAVIVIFLVVVVGLWALLWSVGGGTAYDANDRAVRSARKSADAKARPAVERVAAELTPTLGEPDRRATLDRCSRSTQMLDNRLTCVRSLYLYYALTTPVPDAATVAGPISTTPWPTGWDGGCRPDPGTTRACRGTFETTLVVQVNSVDVSAWNRIPRGVSTMDAVEQEGFSELQAAVDSGPCVIVAYTTTYFSD